MAHEIRNPLQFIRNFASNSEVIAGQIKEAPEQPDNGEVETVDELTEDLVENMQRIVMHSERADRIIADLLVMGRRGDGAFEPVDLNPLLAKQASLAYQAAQAQTPGILGQGPPAVGPGRGPDRRGARGPGPGVSPTWSPTPATPWRSGKS